MEAHEVKAVRRAAETELEKVKRSEGDLSYEKKNERNITLYSARIMGKNRNVIRFGAYDDSGYRMNLIRFGDAADFEQELDEEAGRGAFEGLLRGAGSVTISMMYYPDINSWNGNESVQYVMRDFRFMR